MISKICVHCGSSDIWADAVARWSEEAQDWVLGSADETNVFCELCGGETTAINKDKIMDHRPLHIIAREIRTDWKKVYFGAVPYLEAMACLSSIHGEYYNDSARSVVAYFLANAGTWRGDTARRVKAELKALLAVK